MLKLPLILAATLISNSSVAAKLEQPRLMNKVVIITGASKGIGKSISEVFASHGAKLVLVSRSQDSLNKLVQAIHKQGGDAIYVTADVTKEKDMLYVADETMKRYGRIDVLIHNAGIYPNSRIEDMSVEEWHKVLDTNLTSAFYAVKACLPTMKSQHYGRVVFTSSISGPRTGLPGFSHYTASKSGMNGFMKTIAIELAKYNITVNAVEPGNIMTEGLADLTEAHIKNMIRAIPLGRLGTPEEVALAHLFLASDEARYITGQSIIVDGGQLLPESHFLDY